MTPLQELTNKIHTLVPETMELRFGCVLRTKKDGDLIFCSKKTTYDYYGDGERESFYLRYPDNTVKLWIYGYFSNFTILGHDITLEDVLRAMGSKEEHIHNDDWNVPVSYNVTKIYSMWHLGKPLHLQSEETIELLNSIITTT